MSGYATAPVKGAAVERSIRRRVGRRTGLVGAVLAAVLVSGACGSAHSVEELRAATLGSAVRSGDSGGAENAGNAAAAAGQPSADPNGPGEAGTLPADQAAAGAGSLSTSATSAPASPASKGAAGSPGNATGGTARANSQAGKAKAPGPAAAGSTPTATAAPAGAAAAKREIVLGSIGINSGVIGASFKPLVDGSKAWAADVNARGGLNGHPVRLLSADDGGDPNTALSLARRMVDQDKVLAFYAPHGPGTYQAVEAFLAERGIPTVGGCGCDPTTANSPLVFAAGYQGDRGVAWAQALPIVALTQARKVSVFYCRESPTCAASEKRIQEIHQKLQLQIVHEAQISVTQPDFTAEVLGARNAGAEAIFLIMDNPSIVRVWRSARRQNYKPIMGGQFATHDERFLPTGGADVEGTIVGAAFPHWTSPKLADYSAAVARYVPGGTRGSIGIYSWAGGKLLEAAARAFPAEPTKDDLLKGLYALNGETLGGIVPPLTFKPGQGSDLSNLCTVPLKVENGQFVAPNGDAFTCAPGWEPVRK